MRAKSCIVAGSLLLTSQFAWGAGDDAWTLAGDIGSGAVPLAALGVSIAKQDWQGLWQFGLGYGVTTLGTKAGKRWFPKERPNGANDRSRISGHTSAAFSGAAFLHHRYGWEYGLPAYLAAGVVGYSRVTTDWHHPEDVLLGAALAIGVSYLFTSDYDTGLQVQPQLSERIVGVEVKLPL